MAIEVTGDERDRKRQGVIKETSELKQRAERGDSEAGRALSARIRELDQTAIHNPQKQYAYHMGSTDKKGRVGQMKGMGYEVVPVDAPEQLIAGYEQDGAQVAGSMILMRTKRENYEKRRARNRLVYEMQSGIDQKLEQAKENINKAARDGGFIPAGADITFDESTKS